MRHFNEHLTVPLAGGFLGLVPFWGLPLLGLWLLPEWASICMALLAQYGALIVCFVGAIWWGIALSLPASGLRAGLFAWSLMPCLLALGALWLPDGLTYLALAGLLAWQWLLDYSLLWRQGRIQQWFWHLRSLLTLGALPALLWAGLAGGLGAELLAELQAELPVMAMGWP